MGAAKPRHLGVFFSPCVMWGAVDDRSFPGKSRTLMCTSKVGPAHTTMIEDTLVEQYGVQ